MDRASKSFRTYETSRETNTPRAAEKSIGNITSIIAETSRAEKIPRGTKISRAEKTAGAARTSERKRKGLEQLKLGVVNISHKLWRTNLRAHSYGGVYFQKSVFI